MAEVTRTTKTGWFQDLGEGVTRTTKRGWFQGQPPAAPPEEPATIPILVMAPKAAP
jgi:hypothetical protein